MRLTEEQIERAKTVNLPQFLMANGFELKKAGREYVWKEHDSLHIRDNAPGERGRWYRFSESKGGDNIGFLREYMGMSFVEAVEALNGEHYDRIYTPSRTYEPKPVQKTARELSLAEADNARRVFAYLCKTRGLDYDLISSLVKSGVIAQEQKTGNVLFKYFDEKGKIIGAEKVGTSTEHKFKGIATGSAGGHGFEMCRGDGSNLLFFESSIDMLSYLQMFSPDNCRLVSMMGVKPNIVLDTMVRYGIAPQNVYLCSDNDEAGNDFADRLREQYPEMKRIATPDTYKDWNDMLRGIPKVVEQEKNKKEADRNNMQYYGNEMWNKATDNRDKSLVTMRLSDFQRVQETLEKSGINYYAYEMNGAVRMAVNDKDIDWLRNILGNVNITKSNKPYSPPEKNIFGTVEYRYIPQKEYLTADRDLVLKMAEIMARRGMQFSGRVYPSGKGTLTVSHADLYAVRSIRDEVTNMRKQFASPEKGEPVGNRDYRANRDTHYYMSKLTPEQFKEVKPFLETSVSYHAVSRDGKVAFAVDKENAPAFHRAFENAVREVGMLRNMSDLGLPMEQMIALSPVIHRLSVEDMKLNLADFFDKRYDEAQFSEMLSLVNAYLSQAPAERYGENSKLNDMLEAKSSFDRAIELSDFFSQHDFSDEQRAAITAMFVGDVTRGQIDSIDETFTAEDIQAYDEILHNALQESDIADFLTAHKQAVIDRENAARVPTEEVLFPKADLAKFLAERSLSSDEWEDMAYPLFENGHLDKFKPNDKAILGYHLSEPAFYDLAHRYHNDEDIRRELALGLMEHTASEDIEFVFEDGKISGRTFYYAENLRHSLHTERTEDGYKCSFGGMERFVSFEDIGQAFIDRTHEEFEDLMYWRILDYIRDDIPDIADETVKQLITAFDGAALPDWEKGDNIPKLNRIKKALFDILGDEQQTEKAFAVIAKNKYNVSFEPESSIHFGLLGNGITAYDVSRTDKETNDYPTVAHISPEGVVRIYDNSISAEDMERINEQARSAREKFMNDWNMLSPVQQFQRLYERADISTTVNIGKEKLSMEEKIEKYMPFVFFGEGERPEPEAEKQIESAVESIEFIGDRNSFETVKKAVQSQSFGTTVADGDTLTVVINDNADVKDVRRLVETAQDNGVYLNVPSAKMLEARFGADFMQESHKPSVADLEVGDIIMYDGARREVESISDKSISLKDLDAPDFVGILLGTSDVLAYDGWQEDMESKGFEILSKAEKIESVVDAPEVKKVHLVITNAGFDGGIDDKMEYATVDEAVKAGRDYIADGYLGFSVYNQETKKIEHIEGDFPLDEAFNPNILRINGMHETANEVQDRMDEMDRERYDNPTLLSDVIHKFFKTDCETAETVNGKWKIAVGEGDVVGKVYEFGRPFCDIHNTDDKFVIETFFARDAELSELVYEAMMTCHLDKKIEKNVPEPDTKDLGSVTMRKVGDFYEMYGTNAEIGAEVLGLHMLSKHGEPMVGFPDHIKDEYSKKLSDAGYSVLIEQAFEINPPKREQEYSLEVSMTSDAFDEPYCIAKVDADGEFIDYYKDIDGYIPTFSTIAEVLDFAEKHNLAVTNDLEEIPENLLYTLQDVVDRYFGMDCYSAQTVNGTWELSVVDGEKVGELYHNGEAVCGIYNLGDKMAVEPYQELTSFPKMLADAMLAHNPDKPVEIMDYQRTFETTLDKAKTLINDFCEEEYRDSADFSDLHNVSLAYTTLTDDELPIQVTADLVDYKITYEFDGDVFNTEQYDSIEDMIENGLTGLDFNDLVSVPDDIIKKHTDKDEQTIDLMSDASEVGDISSPADVPSVTLAYKGDIESIAEIKDKALSLGAVVTVDNAEGTISISTYENHKDELDSFAYELGLMAVVDETADIDKPLFTDDSVIEEIQRNERFDTPFWETPDVQGEQLSLFGDLEPIQQKKPEKPKSEFAKGPVVDGVQVYEALAAEIDRGTGFVSGKLRVQDFYEQQHPTLQQLADFLKKEYGTGGHSGEGNISLVDYNSKGLTFSFRNGEKYRHSWYNVAVMTEARLKDNTYLSAEQQAKRQAQKEEMSNDKQIPDTVEVGDRFRHKITGEVSEVVSLTGALPFYTDDCTVTTDKGSYATTENISYDKLLNSNLYEYIGRAEPEKEKPEPDKTVVTTDKSMVAPETEKSDIPTVKNLAQLKRSIKPGMMFEITDHLRPERIGERRVVTGVNSVEFTSQKLNENGEPSGKDIHMEFDKAANWTFNGSELTFRIDENRVLMSFHFVDSLKRNKDTEREPFTEEISGNDDTIKYRITENADEQYKYNVQILTQGENGDFAYSGNGKFCETLDEAHAFIEHDKAERNTDKQHNISQNDNEKNFTITDDALGEGGAKAKFGANVEAIRTLKKIESANLKLAADMFRPRSATAEEKEILSKYVGWGALAKAFDKSDPKWTAEYQELSELLTPEEYRQARSSVNDAFYTSPTIIDGIYEALRNFGFDGGNVLEPAMGIGNFFGRMPEDMQSGSQLYGVEIDSLSGRIAQALYPDADIAIQGFEKNRFQNGSFDVAVGNVPFGELGFKDTVHDTTKLHDYFFAETLDKLKNGGIMAFVTSAGTLDKRDESTRQMLADKTDFIGAIRLPGGKNGAFKDNAGTEVTTDIIFLKKHEGKSVAEMSDIPDWVHIGETADGLPINKYFEQHPDMVLGTVVEGNKLYGSGTMVVAEDGFDLKTALHEAVSKLSADISHERGRDVYAKTADGVQVQIPSNLRNYSFFMSDDQVFFKKNNAACEFRFDKGTAQHKRFKAFIEMRDLTRDLLEAQELDKPDSVIKELQARLNTAYDDFYAKYGLIHSQTNKRYFSEDVSYNLVAGLEKSYDKNVLKEKSDIFFKRTIVPPKAIDHVETALEALTLSVAEKAQVDFEYMGKLTGMTEDELKHDLMGEIFKVPHTENDYQTASEYLSGDIRVKLREAEEIAEYDADFNINVSALKAAMPEPLKAGDIDVKIGATWLDPKYYEQFIYELLQTPQYQRSDGPTARWNKSAVIGVEYSEHTNSFHVSNKSSDKSVLATQKFGSHNMNAYDIFEHILNLQDPKIYKTIEVPDPDNWGETKEKRVVDIDATRVVQRKADNIRKAFKNWIFKAPVRREAIVQRYNELFNSIRPREYDGSALSFPMMTSEIQLHDHQKNAIAHAMFGGNTLFAHSVGAGKTFEMIATAMESKRLGLCTKSLFAVPNHLTEQIGNDFQKLYPSANILVATKKDFKRENRQQLFAKIATGNYDAVIIGHSQLGMIPISKERQVMTIQSQIDDILQGIDELKRNEGSKFQIKAMERTRKSLQKQLDKLEKSNQDDTLTFEQLGVDKIFVDEAHECTTRS